MVARVRLLLAAALVAASSPPATAQQSSPPADSASTAPVAADLLMDINQVEARMPGLARAMPADEVGRGPGAGIRSVSEALMHVAAGNYFMPAAIGCPVDTSTGVKGDAYARSNGIAPPWGS
jgi:hypothetical protein